jgi:integrase
MATLRLTKRNVDGLNPGSKAYVTYDSEVTGFGVRVMPSGLKSWIIEYRRGAGGRGISKTRLSLGRTTLLTPNEARRVARDKLADARRGVDPAAERSAERDMPTLAKLADLHLAEVLAKRSAGTHALYRHYADRFVKPELGSRKASAVTRADLAKLHRHIGEDRPVTANRVIAFISGIYAFAAKAGLVPEGLNSARGIEKFQEEGRERFLSAEEFQQLGIALREAETSGLEWAPDPAKPTSKHAPKAENRRVVFGTHVTGAIRLLLFTGCRLREILHLRWSDIDFERGMLFLPKSKTGKKSVVLSAPAFQVLTTLPRAGSYVIRALARRRRERI